MQNVKQYARIMVTKLLLIIFPIVAVNFLFRIIIIIYQLKYFTKQATENVNTVSKVQAIEMKYPYSILSIYEEEFEKINYFFLFDSLFQFVTIVAIKMIHHFIHK